MTDRPWLSVRKTRSRRALVFLVAVVAIALLVRLGLAGSQLVVHDHGHEATHWHIVPTFAVEDASVLAAGWHSREHSDSRQDVESGFIHLADPLLLPRVTSWGSPRVPAAALAGTRIESWRAGRASALLRPVPGAPERAPPRKQRSGLASLLVSSRAILI